MKKLVGINLCAAALTVVLALSGGAAMAKGGGGGGGGGTKPPASPPPPASGAWPAAFPLPTSPGTVLSQSSTKAVVRSTDSVEIVNNKLDALYVTQKGCTQKFAVNKPKDYVCTNPATGKAQEITFFFAALDPTPTDPSRSQTTAFLA